MKQGGDEDDIVAPTVKSIGIKAAELARSNRSECFVCHAAIPKHGFRLHYRFRESLGMDGLRWIHWACVDRLPREHSHQNMRNLKWLFRSATSDDDRSLLTESIKLLEAAGP